MGIAEKAFSALWHTLPVAGKLGNVKGIIKKSPTNIKDLRVSVKENHEDSMLLVETYLLTTLM